MARAVKQNLPQPPPQYDQDYIAQLVNAVNRYIIQREAPGELTTARVIMTDPPIVDAAPAAGVAAYPDTALLPTGTVYLAKPGAKYFLTVVTEQDT